MTKTSLEVVAEAHRRIKVLSNDRDPSSDMVTYGQSQLSGLFEELTNAPHSMVFAWTLETVPEYMWRPLSWLLAHDIAPHYEIAPRDSYATAMGRVRAIAFPDDREDRRDTDDDGIISDDEAEAGKAALYY